MSSCHQGLLAATVVITRPVHSRAKHSSRAVEHGVRSKAGARGLEATSPGLAALSSSSWTLCSSAPHPSFSSSLEKPHPRSIWAPTFVPRAPESLGIQTSQFAFTSNSSESISYPDFTVTSLQTQDGLGNGTSSLPPAAFSFGAVGQGDLINKTRRKTGGWAGPINCGLPRSSEVIRC